jgi:hypothetical protein
LPATQEVEIRKMEVQGQPWQKVKETPSQQKSGMATYVCNTSCQGGIGRKIAVQPALGKKHKIISEK